MYLCDAQMLDNYASADSLLSLLKCPEFSVDEQFTTHQWLQNTLPKRMIYERLYGDLLKETERPLRILDIGGGYSALTRIIAKNHNYTLLEIFAHDSPQRLERLVQTYSEPFWINKDWYQFEPKGRYDIIIANDLFPNVDQRLSMFLDKYLSVTSEVRMSLTCYPTPRFYPVKRVDAEEIFFYLAWDERQLADTLSRFSESIKDYNADLFSNLPDSLFPNGRQVCLVQLAGTQSPIKDWLSRSVTPIVSTN